MIDGESLLAAPDRLTPANPFQSSRVSPGAIAYRFCNGESVEDLLNRWRSLGRRAQIVGPHGSGKTTLLIALSRLLAEHGERVETITLRDGQASLPALTNRAELPSTVVMIDGFEQLNWLSRLRLAWRMRRRNCGWIITAHRKVAFPKFALLWQTATNPALAAQLLEDISAASVLSPDDLTRAFERRQGNLREVWFDLYDVYERRRKHSK